MAITLYALKAHGLEGSLEEPDWPPLTLPEVDSLLRRYRQAGGAERLLSRSPRPFSAAAVVATPMGRVFVKRHHRSVRDCEGLLEEHRLIAHLADAMHEGKDEGLDETGFHPGLVQAVLANQDGETVTTDGEWTYEVHLLARGEDVYEQALSWTPFLCKHHARAAGRALARLHRAAGSYRAPARNTRPLVTSFTIFAGPELEARQALGASNDDTYMRMQTYLDRRPLLRTYAEERDWRIPFGELFLPLYRNLEPWLAYLRPLWTHNDFHASNLTWSGGGGDGEVLGIIDFGLADRTNAVHDLATAIERNIVEWLRLTKPGSAVVHLDQAPANPRRRERSPRASRRRSASSARSA